MDILEALRERRSTRAFLDKPVDRDTLERLLTLATQAPSAINIQPWEITIVSGEERKRLSRILVKRMRERNISCGPGASRPLQVHFVERQKGLLNSIAPNLPADTPFQDFINEGSCNFYGAPTAIIITIDEVFSKARLTDIGLLVAYLVLAAHGLGLGSCPIGLITAFESHYFWPDFRDDLKEVHRVMKQGGQLLIVGAVYKNEKYERRNQRIVDAIGMTYLSIEEFREVLEGVGYSEFDALEEKNKGWLAVKCRKQEGGIA